MEKIKFNYRIPEFIRELTENEIRSNLSKLTPRKIYWDDLAVGDNSTMRIKLSRKIITLFCLLINDFSTISNDFSSMHAPGTYLLGLSSGVSGIYLLGSGIFLVEKKETNFYHQVKPGDIILIRNEIIRKWSELKNGKPRYFVEIQQKFFKNNENTKPILVGSTGSIAGILEKKRPNTVQIRRIQNEIDFKLPKILDKIPEDDLINQIKKISEFNKDEIKKIGSNYNDTLDIDKKYIISNKITVSAKLILLFAMISNDHNPLHCSLEFASALPKNLFGGKNIAHGALSISLIGCLYNLQLLFPSMNLKLIKKKKGRFIEPVKLGDKIIIISELKIVKNIINVKDHNFSLDTKEKIYIVNENSDLERNLAVISGSIYNIDLND
jgi:acyl dehydratase